MAKFERVAEKAPLFWIALVETNNIGTNDDAIELLAWPYRCSLALTDATLTYFSYPKIPIGTLMPVREKCMSYTYVSITCEKYFKVDLPRTANFSSVKKRREQWMDAVREECGKMPCVIRSGGGNRASKDACRRLHV